MENEEKKSKVEHWNMIFDFANLILFDEFGIGDNLEVEVASIWFYGKFDTYYVRH